MGAGASASLKTTLQASSNDALDDLLQAGAAACQCIMKFIRVQAYSYRREDWFDATIISISENGALVRYFVGDDERSKEIPFAELSDLLKPISESTPDLVEALATLPNELIKWYFAAVLDDLFQTSDFSGKIACKQIAKLLRVQLHSSEGIWIDATLDTISEHAAVVSYELGGQTLRIEIPLGAVSSTLQPTAVSMPALVEAVAAFPNVSAKQACAAVLDKILQTSEFSARATAHSSCSMVLGDRVRLTAAGCAVQDDYRWDDDALAPGDVGEVIQFDRFDPTWMKVRGPTGKHDWYQDGIIESATAGGA